MDEFCTCGAQLPPDARFCHKCGKPQREEPALAVWDEGPLQPPAPPPPAPPPEIGLRNGLALRVGLLAGSLAFLTSSLPIPPLFRLLFLLGAGAFAAYLYRRRSGFRVEVRGGLKMGWIAGLFCFVIFTVLFTFSFAALAVMARDGGMTAYMKENLSHMGMPEESIRQAMEIFENPVQVLWMLFWLFLTSTSLPALGGALGARLMDRN
ncbi:MAG: zinc ribbon domain-containing protein [Bryobacterales bacterium]|nr:zinc ribbon domain-containing protein [Bryobacterales bacterium]